MTTVTHDMYQWLKGSFSIVVMSVVAVKTPADRAGSPQGCIRMGYRQQKMMSRPHRPAEERPAPSPERRSNVAFANAKRWTIPLADNEHQLLPLTAPPPPPPSSLPQLGTSLTA